MNKREITGALLMLLAAFIFGSGIAAQDMAIEYMGSFSIIAIRSWIAAAAMLPLIKLMDARGISTKTPEEPTARKTYLKSLWIGGSLCGVMLFLACFCQQFGLIYTTVAKAGFITTLYIFLVPIVSLFLGKKVNPIIWFCVILALVGMYLLCITERFVLGFGDTLMVFCGLALTAQIILIDRLAPNIDGLRLNFVQMVSMGAVSTVFMIIFETPTMAGFISGLGPILYLSLINNGGAYFIQIIAQRMISPAVAGLIMGLESVFGTLCGWALLGQTLTGRELTGCAIMFAAIVISQLPELRSEKSAKTK